MNTTEILTIGSAGSNIPRPVWCLAERIARIHGEVSIARERSGFIIYMANPRLVEKEGEHELQAKHMAVLADKYLGTGQYANLQDPQNKKMHDLRKKGIDIGCCYCMKTQEKRKMNDILSPLSRPRNINIHKQKAKLEIKQSSYKDLLEIDENGNVVPECPKALIPVHMLPKEHPATFYIESRGFSRERLWEQFKCSWCEKELPVDPDKGRFYKKFGTHFTQTPQGRIIFFVYINGVRVGWQARMLEHHYDNIHYIWHPYNNRWEAVYEVDPATDVKTYLHSPAVKPAKYINAKGMLKSSSLMGLDAAVDHNTSIGNDYCILVEGPLDAARIGPPGIAMLGKMLSPEQAAVIRQHFKRVFTIIDNDAAGRSSLASIQANLGPLFKGNITLPSSVKDIGELSYEEASVIIQNYLDKHAARTITRRA